MAPCSNRQCRVWQTSPAPCNDRKAGRLLGFHRCEAGFLFSAGSCRQQHETRLRRLIRAPYQARSARTAVGTASVFARKAASAA